MCQLAAFTDDRIKVSTVELDSTGKNYTYITLEKLTTQYPMHEFFFIMGGDSLDYFDHWVYPEIITKLCTILVMPRKPYSGSSLAEKIQKLNELYSADIRMIECEEYPVSSTILNSVGLGLCNILFNN